MSGRKKHIKAEDEVGIELRSDSAEVTRVEVLQRTRSRLATASSMMQQASGITCTKLNDTNYMSWSFKLEIYLRSHCGSMLKILLIMMMMRDVQMMIKQEPQ